METHPIGSLQSLATAHPDLTVWSKDEFTGETGWRRPVRWFTTHPLRAFEALCETSCFLSSLKCGDVVTTTIGGFASTCAQGVSIGLPVGVSL